MWHPLPFSRGVACGTLTTAVFCPASLKVRLRTVRGAEAVARAEVSRPWHDDVSVTVLLWARTPDLAMEAVQDAGLADAVVGATAALGPLATPSPRFRVWVSVGERGLLSDGSGWQQSELEESVARHLGGSLALRSRLSRLP